MYTTGFHPRGQRNADLCLSYGCERFPSKGKPFPHNCVSVCDARDLCTCVAAAAAADAAAAAAAAPFVLRGEAANAVPPMKPAPASPGQDSEAKSTEQAVLDQKISAPVPSSSSCLPDAMQTGAPITCWARPPTSPLRCFFERLLRITLGLVDCPGDHTRLPQQMSGGGGLERDLHQQGQHRCPPHSVCMDRERTIPIKRERVAAESRRSMSSHISSTPRSYLSIIIFHSCLCLYSRVNACKQTNTRNAKRCAEERRPNNRSISNTSKKTIRSRFSCSLGCA